MCILIQYPALFSVILVVCSQTKGMSSKDANLDKKIQGKGNM